MTIDELAVMTQREYESIRSEMATREELRAAENNILRAIEHLDGRLCVYTSRWNNEFERLADNVRDIENRLRTREAPS